MSAISPTLPGSLIRGPLPSASVRLSVRRTTNSCGSLPWLTTLKVTLPADALSQAASPAHSSSAPATVPAPVSIVVVQDPLGSFRRVDELLPQPAVNAA